MVNSTLALLALITHSDFVGLMPATIAAHPAAVKWMRIVPIRAGNLKLRLGAIVRKASLLKRQDTSNNGQILGYNFYTSTDGVTWTLSAHGTFGTDNTEKTVTIATQ